MSADDQTPNAKDGGAWPVFEALLQLHTRREVYDHIRSNADLLLDKGLVMVLRVGAALKPGKPMTEEFRRFADLFDRCRVEGIDPVFAALDREFQEKAVRLDQLWASFTVARKSPDGDGMAEEMIGLADELAFIRPWADPSVRRHIYMIKGHGLERRGERFKDLDAFGKAGRTFEQAYQVSRAGADQKGCLHAALGVSQTTLGMMRNMPDGDTGGINVWSGLAMVGHKVLQKYVSALDCDDPGVFILAGRLGLFANFDGLVRTGSFTPAPLPPTVASGSAAAGGMKLASVLVHLLSLVSEAAKAKEKGEVPFAGEDVVQTVMGPILDAMRDVRPEIGLAAWLNTRDGMAKLDMAQGRRDQAITQLREALQKGRQHLFVMPDGKALNDALGALSNVARTLAECYADQGDASEVYWTIARSRTVRASVELATARMESDPELASVVAQKRRLQSLREEIADLATRAETLRESLQSAAERGPQDGAAVARWEPLVALQKLHQQKLAALNTEVGSFNEALVAKGLGASFDPPPIATLARAIPEGGAAVIAFAGDKSGWLLTIPHGSVSLRPEHLQKLPDLTNAAVAELAGKDADRPQGWLDALALIKKAFRNEVTAGDTGLTGFSKAIDGMTARLWTILMGPLDAALRKIGLPPDGSAEIVLMPPGSLSIMPLQAAWRPDPEGINGRRAFLEDWPISISQSPQALVAAAQRLRQPARSGRQALGVTDPLGDLSKALGVPEDFENPGLAGFDPDHRRDLRGQAATGDEVMRALAGRNYLAFFSHGIWDAQSPARSGLVVAPSDGTLDKGDAGQDRIPPHELLTLARLRRESVDLGACRLWILAACESWGLNLTFPDEFTGLGPGLAAEVPAVLSTLYPVDVTTTELVIRAFMRLHLGDGLSPARALRRVQMAMRAGRETLVDLARPGPEEPATREGEGSKTMALPGPRAIVVPMFFDDDDEDPPATGPQDPSGITVGGADWCQSYFWAAYSLAGL